MSEYAYLLFDLFAMSSLLLTLFIDVKFWNRWRGLLFGIGAVSIPFIIWDIASTYMKHWQFNREYTMDLRIAGLPLGEVLFFVAVPVACMVVWTIIERTYSERIVSNQRIRGILINAALVMVALGIFVPGIYTSAVLLAGAITCAMLTRRLDLVGNRRFWVFQVVSLGLFMASNTYLTRLPVFYYNEEAIMGWYVGTIPIEDFLYNFALVNLFLLCFLRYDKKNGRPVKAAVR